MPSRRSVLQSMLAGAAVPLFPAQADAAVTLKEAFKNDFRIGAAINAAQFTGRDARGGAIIEAEFNSISPEDCLKWERIHPRPGVYDFDLADKYVAFGTANAKFVVGHVLIWHMQTPDWVFLDDKGNLAGREVLLERMRDHIHTVVGRYKGRIHSWDVVNEPVGDDGLLRRSPWYRILGEDYIAKAFHFAREADPGAILLYNDYGIEYEARRKAAEALIVKLKENGVPVTGVGLQGHYSLDEPALGQLDAAIYNFGRMGLKVSMTELDINVLPRALRQNTADPSYHVAQDAALNPYTNGLPDKVQRQLARRYADLFRVFREHHDVLDRVTFWGVTDADSWLNDWPVKGRTSYPLLFDREGKRKPAYDAVIDVAKG